MEKIIKRQTIIIVWKWRFFPNPISEEVLDKLYGGKVPDIAATQGVYVPPNGDKSKNDKAFHIPFPVEWSEVCPNARLVAAAIYQGAGAESRLSQLLDDTLQFYMQPEGSESEEEHKVMLFLHRANGYDERDVERLLKQREDTRNFKVFLFSDRRDFLYYDTRKSGFLDDVGYFKAFRDDQGNFISVQDTKRGEIKQPYFDRVWGYYQNEFERKVYKLKEDLFDGLFPLLLPGAPSISREACIAQIKSAAPDELLWYRLKSFLGEYEDIGCKDPEQFDANTALEKEVDVVIRAEKERGESLLFDDCIANIRQQESKDDTFISVEYDDIKEHLRTILFAESDVKVKDLRSVASKLNYLVKIIPGVMD